MSGDTKRFLSLSDNLSLRIMQRQGGRAVQCGKNLHQRGIKQLFSGNTNLTLWKGIKCRTMTGVLLIALVEECDHGRVTFVYHHEVYSNAVTEAPLQDSVTPARAVALSRFWCRAFNVHYYDMYLTSLHIREFTWIILFYFFFLGKVLFCIDMK